jgi:hypothetical protein
MTSQLDFSRVSASAIACHVLGRKYQREHLIGHQPESEKQWLSFALGYPFLGLREPKRLLVLMCLHLAHMTSKSQIVTRFVFSQLGWKSAGLKANLLGCPTNFMTLVANCDSHTVLSGLTIRKASSCVVPDDPHLGAFQ